MADGQSSTTLNVGRTDCTEMVEKSSVGIWATFAPGRIKFTSGYEGFVLRREQVFQYAQWLRRVDWQFFMTLTFSRRVSHPQAVRVFAEFIDGLEAYVRCPMTFIRGDERRFSGCGMPEIPLHFHTVLTSAFRLDRVYIHDAWTRLAGNRRDGAGADVRAYDASQDGLAYVLKFAVVSGDWSFGNLDLVLIDDSSKLNARARRRVARHAMRMQQSQERTSGHNVPG